MTAATITDTCTFGDCQGAATYLVTFRDKHGHVTDAGSACDRHAWFYADSPLVTVEGLS